MLGPIGSDIMLIFRLLSPDEIDKYIVYDDKEEVVGGTLALASGGESLQYDDEKPHLENSSKSKKFPKDHQAKIIPLDEFKDKIGKKNTEIVEAYAAQEGTLEEEINEESKKESKSLPKSSELESIGVLSASTIKNIESDREKKENKNKESATVFLLKEREKMRASKKRLIEQYAIKSYQTNAAQEFYEENEDDLLDEESTSDLKGILLNKKHY